MAGYFKMVPLAGAVLLPTKGLLEIGERGTPFATMPGTTAGI